MLTNSSLISFKKATIKKENFEENKLPASLIDLRTKEKLKHLFINEKSMICLTCMVKNEIINKAELFYNLKNQLIKYI